MLRTWPGADTASNVRRIGPADVSSVTSYSVWSRSMALAAFCRSAGEALAMKTPRGADTLGTHAERQLDSRHR